MNMPPDTVSARAIQSIGPLVGLLRQELESAGIPGPGEIPRTIAGFTRWYLEVVQLLESHLAGAAGQQPMLRAEVELMCRCALSGRSLGEAIAICTRFCAMLHPRAGRITLERLGDGASFRLDSLRPEVSMASSLTDITGLFAFNQLFQWLVGTDLQLQQVRIGPIRRDDVLPFLKLFRAPVLAGGHDYALEFPASMLELPVVRSPAAFPPFFEVYPCGVFLDHTVDLAQQVEAVLAAAARQGTRLPTQEELAQTLGLSLSTFRRRLARSGVAFRQLREECIIQRARALLERGDMSVAEIAAHLGYSDAAAFRRACRQWTGVSPTRWADTRIGAPAE